jgi:diacylglycerol kinase (ATP)
MRVTLVHNPAAGDERPSRDDLLEALRAAGHAPRYHAATEAGIAAALQDPGDLLAIAGGDGTVRNVATQLAGRGVPIAVLPLGTANNIARTLGLRGEPHELIARWDPAHRLPFDVGVARGPWGEAHFLEGVGCGLFPQMVLAIKTGEEDLGAPASARAELRGALECFHDYFDEYRARPLRVSLDGRDLSGEFLLVEALNTGGFGPNLFLAPDADPADGMLDVVLVTERDRAALDAYLDHRLDGADHQAELPKYRGRELRILWTGFEVHIDDELWLERRDRVRERAAAHPEQGAPISVSLVPRALEFLADSG